ncbi:hypothetical protein P154DRAFT_525257 [Amniculicola lignicola CBS 123094]|uniref:PH domain-containing protein n=1 Tax=Amniculicola lignicola CBS 123094 TaxID=1392246 RepID=A0A6A5W4P7_9PLEO|nr:hypothetical protein P154DRAFT_525257 [Amniculicola lignicola CBS 123094]
MSAAVEEQKPVVPVEASTVEPTPAPVVADKPVEAAEPTVEEPAKTEEPAAPAEEKKEVKPAEPILSGALGYKAPGLKNAFRFSKKHFWFTEEPVSTEGLAHYLRGEKPEVAHPTAAWSSKTGKGLVYFVKHAEQTDKPAGVLNLSEATEVTKDGFTSFFVKIAGHKHTFEAQTPKERDGWLASFEKAFAEAKELKEEIVNSEEYKEVKATLAKPIALVHHTAKESTPKKSSDVAPKLAEAESSTAAETPAAARTGSSSSSSDDEEKRKKKASKSKSRSVSRGKRASIFGNFLGKKEKVEDKKEEKKEETEAKKEETPGAEPAPVVAAPVIVEELPKPVAEEAKTEETPVVAEASAPAEEKKVEEPKPKPTKRASIFGGFIKGLKSPTKEKDESEVVPAPPAKETETTAVAPKVEETPAPAAETPVATTEAPKEEVKPTTPHKEKEHFSFGKFLGAAKEKAKSPVHEKAPEPKAEEPVKKEEPVAPVAPVEPVVEAPKEEKKEEENTPTTKKRGSIFEKYGEKGLGLLRNASKAGRSKKEDKATPATAKVEETPEPKEEKVEEPKPVEKKEETPIADAETKAIGDVVPEAVTVGEAPKSTTQVSATA